MKVNLKEVIPEISWRLPNGYSMAAKREAGNVVIDDQSPHRVLVEWITIDGRESRDLDDGMWAEKMKNGWYMLQVSIADPSEVIEPLGIIDTEAMKKTTSIYLNTHTIHMLPPKLSTDLVSLNHNKTRLSLTIQLEFDENMDVVTSDIFESKFYNKKRFDYESFSSQFQNRYSDFYDQLDLLYEITKKLYAKRMEKWAVDFDESDRRIGWFEAKKAIASLIVQEAAIAANISSSIYVIKNKIEGIHRNHMPEYRWKKMPTKTSDWERALYGIEMNYHRWLAEEHYTHFTSPIRRLADLILHRQIKSHLRDDEPVYNKEDLSVLTHHINTQRSVLEILWKTHNYNAARLQRHRKVKRRFEKVKEQNGWLKVYHIKEDIRKWVKTWLKLPKEIRDDIIEQIKNGRDIESWSWSLWVFLCSDEYEIIEALREKVLSFPVAKCNKFLRIIGQTIIMKKENKAIEIREAERKVKWEYELKIEVRYLWEKIIKAISNIDIHKNNPWLFERQVNLKKWHIRREALIEIFNYFGKK